MKLRVNEIFCSLQGEGFYTGTAAVFLRLSGCNMKCTFCDTRHETFQEMSIEQIVSAVSAYTPRHIVITGGEPCMQLTRHLTDALHTAGFFIQMETNGTLPLPDGAEVDWITCSPKKDKISLAKVHELKVLCYGGDEAIISQRLKPYENFPAQEYRLQPLDTGNEEKNAIIINDTINYITNHTQWKLSLQTHKILNVR